MKVYIDSFICSVVSFMIFLATFNYFKVKYPYHIVYSFMLASIAFILFFIFKNKSHKKLSLTQKENKELKNFTDYLIVKNHQELLTEFSFYLQKAGYMPKKRKNALLLEQQKTIVYLLFNIDSITKNEIISVLKQTPTGYKTAIISTALQEESKTLCKILQDKITLVSVDSVYKFLKENQMLPTVSFTLTPKKVKLKILLKECFNKKRCTHFFYVGTIMLVFSLFVFYPKYYLIMGTLFCTYGLICLFYGKKTT
ncbi:MAG: hypothetical protein J6C97_04940 [Clostridia bacterium]|nr:hypothetical protein [Clostridia bacterium]